MSVIYLRHPRHGSKVAVSELEAKQDEGNGWERFDPTRDPLDHDGDGHKGGSLPRKRGRPPKQ